ncbi:energy transducer TonB [Sphaerotilus mobilis]|uniref:Outer membrane transport energization protein TonB n=1 Tax=Sphaerotilus mobilis TaxID=47994 RepID=A0A4Q7L8E7_9BURK|nr:energy transducer TonB [Sphaerotilus mobilis]RZS46688.1 outer membrane transport energization protein TonB [Sphaerotilus mobilis]
MEDYASRQRKPTKHLIGLGLVVVLHVGLLWAINSGLARAFVKKIKGPVEAVMLEEAKPDIPPPPPPPPPPPQKNAPPPPPPPAYVPPVEVQVTQAPAANAIAAVTSAPPKVEAPPPPPPAPAPAPPAPPPPAPPPAEPVRTPAVVNASGCEKPEYPSASRRLEEEGTVSLRFLVGIDGKVIQAEVDKSSGHKRLDEAARSGLSRCTFKPATVDGKPEQGWATMKYTWRLE